MVAAGLSPNEERKKGAELSDSYYNASEDTTNYVLTLKDGDIKETKDIKADIVISVPDSGTAAAVGYSLESGVPFMEGLTKNRYVAGRLFSLRKTSALTP